MKRYIFAAIVLFSMTISASSQDWSGKGNTVAAGDYYLYNVKSGKYLTWGTNHGTRATLVQQAGELVTLTASNNAYKVTFPTITTSKKGLFLDGSNLPFCDNDAAEFTFTETTSGSKVYTISTGGRYLACRSDFSAEPTPLETTDNASSDCATWMLIKRQDRIDALTNATADTPMDATFYISGAEINQNFDNAGAWDGTDPTFNGRTGNLEATGFAAENYWGASVESYQTLTGLPAGKYRLSCYGFYRDGSATDAGTKYANGTEDIKAYLFAGDKQTKLSSIMVGANTSNGDGGVEASSGKWVPNDMAQAVLFFFRGRYPAVTVDAIVSDDGQLKVGIRKDAGTEQKWTIWDRFRLTYYGDDLTAYAEQLEAAVTAANDFIATHTVPTAAENAISNVVTEKNKTYTTKADYIAATQAINDIVAQYNTDELKNTYAAYKAMRSNVQGLENTSLYNYTDPGTAKSTLDGAITSANTAVEDATTAAAINTQTANLRAAALTFVSNVTAEDGNPFNLTFLASTAAADWQTASGLNAAATAPAWSVPKPDASMADFVESYTEAEGGESITGNILYQTLTEMPAGYYTVALYAAASYTPNRGSLTEKCTDGQPNITFGFAGDNNLSLPVVHRTSLSAADQVPVNLSVQLTSSGELTFGIKKTDAGSNWHVAQIYTITYSKDPDLTVLKSDRDALVSEAQGLLASEDANLLTTAQQNALSTAISTAEAANTFDALTEVTMTSLPNAIQTARQQIQTVKDNRALMLAALERFENDYNLADGTDYRRVTMSTDAWATLLTKVNAVTTALDDVSQAANYGTVKDALIAQMDATDASLRLFKSYKAMVEGTTSLNIAGSYGAGGNMDDDAAETAAITALNTAFVNYALAQDASINMAAFLGDNLDFNTAQGTMIAGKGNGVDDGNYGIFDLAGWEEICKDYDSNYYIQTANTKASGKLYIRSNWEGNHPTLQVMKQRMLPEGVYKLALSWNSNMENMENKSYYKLGDETVAIGEATTEAKTLEYEFKVTGAAQPFDLSFGFKRTSDGNNPAEIQVDNVTLTYKATVILADNDNNDQTITDNKNKTCNVKLDGRTLFKDGNWNTLCLPFGMTTFTGSPLETATVMELDTEGKYDSTGNLNEDGTYQTGLDTDNNTLYLFFKETQSIEAGKPYLVKWSADDNLVSPVFRGVTISDAAQQTITSSDSEVSFKGIYSPTPLAKDKSDLYIGSTNQLTWPNTDGDFYVNSCRSYFHIDLSGTTREAKLRSNVLPFDDHDATGIEATAIEAKTHDGSWFTLDGRKLDTKPAMKGVYIKEGKKVVIQ